MYDFFPIKEVTEPPRDDPCFTCPTCHHPLSRLDGNPSHPPLDPLPIHPGFTLTHDLYYPNPHYYVIPSADPTMGSMYGMPPPPPPPPPPSPSPSPYYQLGFLTAPHVGYMGIDEDEDYVTLTEDELGEVFALFMQKLSAKRGQGRRRRGRRGVTGESGSTGEVDNHI